MTTRAEFVATARGYVGTPYHHQGRTPGVGMDCPAPLILAAREHGIVPSDFDVTGYSSEPDGVTLKRLCDEHLQAIEPGDVQSGDVLLCRFRGGHPRHLGIVTDTTPGRWYWIEAEGQRQRQVREHRVLLGVMRIAQAYRVPGLTP